MISGGSVFKMGGGFLVAKALGMLLCTLFVFGCVTSRENDYVSSAISEAMQEPLVSEQQSFPASSDEASVYSVSTPTIVSVSPGGTVTATPAAGVSVTAPSQLTVVMPSVASSTTVQPEPPRVVTPPVRVSTVPKVNVKVEPPTEEDGEVVAPVTPPFTPPAHAASPRATTPVAPVASGAPVESLEPVAPVVASVPSHEDSPSQAAGTSESVAPAAQEANSITGWHAGMLKPATPTIQPESVLWISVTEDPSLNGRYSVNNSAAIDFGYVGMVFLQDMTVEQAEAAIKNVLEGRYLNHASVSVKIAKASYDFVGVLGNVETPGEIKIGPGATITLNDALRRAGGLRGNRESNRVKIVRGGLRTPFGPAAEGEVLSLVTEGGQLRIPDVYLRNNDLVYTFASESPQLGGG